MFENLELIINLYFHLKLDLMKFKLCKLLVFRITLHVAFAQVTLVHNFIFIMTHLNR